MKTQRLEYLDTLNILFSGRNATGPQAAGVNKILAPPEEIPIDPKLRNTDVPDVFYDSDIEQHYGRDNSPSIPQNIMKEKSALSGNSIRRGKKRAAEDVDASNGRDNSRNGKKLKTHGG